MEEVLEPLKHTYPGREKQLNELFYLFGMSNKPYPLNVFICGGPSTGKSSVTTAFLNAFNIKYAFVNLIECYSSKILFESILNQLTNHKIDPKLGTPYAKCENLMEFCNQVKSIVDTFELNQSVIVVDKAEELRNMEFNLLPAFLKLRKLTEISISVIFLSDIVFEKYYFKLNIVEPLKICFPQYNKDELLEILTEDFKFAQVSLFDHYNKTLNFTVEFFQGYLNVFLSFFYRACRDLRELRQMSRKNFIFYCEPIYKGQLTLNDSMALWKNISPILTSSAEVLYLRITSATSSKNSIGKTTQKLELPFYGKYLLIAAYLASYNSSKDDRRLFMKFHGKKRKTNKEVQQKSKVSEQLNTQIGPKAFALDRLLAIFYSILDDKVGFNNHLLVQVSSLVELQLLSLVSDDSNLDGRKYKCTTNFETIQMVSKMVGFNIRKYLSDFSHF
ncbi:hypothetical protein ABEB36_012440 [Hypothenemus hampei]|uniref:Origin recognition complex subunit 5 n=1 Tax=Hypothenemus hampei TaxID=57062 RepID=A0ABD1EBZ0_HYPHA